MLSFFLTSCLIPISNKRFFSIYSAPIFEGSNGYRLKYNGIYVSINDSDGFVFFTKGKVKWFSGYWSNAKVFWSNQDSAWYNIYASQFSYNKQEKWGEYMIINDSFFAEEFNFNKTNFVVRDVFRQKGVIINDTTLVLSTWYSVSDNFEFLNGIDTFRFYRTHLKPDSTKIWYQNKRWYKKDVHESRK